jgi:hypothetical protein
LTDPILSPTQEGVASLIIKKRDVINQKAKELFLAVTKGRELNNVINRFADTLTKDPHLQEYVLLFFVCFPLLISKPSSSGRCGLGCVR